MAKYTTQLRSAIDGGVTIFDFDYPIFDSTYKTVLEQKIIDYYYFREIGLETVTQFKHFLKSKMNRIMPYYNQLYTANDKFLAMDYFKNKNLTQTDTRTSEADSAGTSTSTGDNTDTVTFSDTPQSQLGGLDYATTKTTSVGTAGGTGSTTGKVTTTDTYLSTIAGDDGMRYPASVFIELKESFINIDQMIIDELNTLFMNIY